jgi:phosphate transport system substrate-binding protein
VNRNALRRPATQMAVAASLALILAGCGGQSNGTGNADGNLSGEVVADGSSTVAPLTTAAQELFREEPAYSDVNVSVATSGTGGGFEKFCAGKTDLQDASRPIDEEEKQVCEKNGVEYTEIVVANDALTVVVNPENDWADCLTVKQLQKIWAPESEGEVTNWNQVDPSFPDVPLELYGAGTDSGTFDYFTEAINGEEGASRSDYNATEDDNTTVQGVSGSKGAMGYFGYSYYEENSDKLKAVAIDNGQGCVEPSVETAQSGEYTPLARPLFIYVADKSYAEKSQVAAFVDYYIENINEIAELAQFVPLNDEQMAESEEDLASLSQ